MGRNRSKNDARRLEARKEVGEALSRFQDSLASNGNLEMKDFTSNLEDNRAFNVIPQILVDHTSQESLISQINDTTKDQVAIAIAFSHSLEKLDDVSNQVCQRLQGLYLFGTINVTSEKILQFLRRCPNLKSLSLIQVDDYSKYFLENLFADGVLPNLEFLEVSHANNNAVAAMYTSPNLRKIVFRWPDPSITNNGFKILVDNGGAKNLVAISGGSLEDDLSESLSKSFLKVTLPKFVAGEAREHDLKHISVGTSVSSLPIQERSNYAEQDSLPFAVIPPERMTSKQLRDAFKNRGVTHDDIPHGIVKMRAALMKGGFSVEEEAAIQNTKHADHLSNTKLLTLKAEIKKLQTKIRKIEKNDSAKLYPELVKHEMVSIMKKEYNKVVTSKWTREDVARALHQKRYQGGGTGTGRVTNLKNELALVQLKLLGTSNKIKSLQTDAKKYFHQKKAAKPSSYTKRPLAHASLVVY